MTDGLETQRRALTGITFHRDGKSWTMAPSDADVVIGILRIAGLKIVSRNPPDFVIETLIDNPPKNSDWDEIWQPLWDASPPGEAAPDGL